MGGWGGGQWLRGRQSAGRLLQGNSVFMSLPVASALAFIILLRLARRTSFLETNPVLRFFLLPTLGWLDQAQKVFSGPANSDPVLAFVQNTVAQKVAFPCCGVCCLRWLAHWLPSGSEYLRFLKFGPWPSFVYAAALVLPKRLLRLSLESTSSSTRCLSRSRSPLRGSSPRTPSRRRSAVPVLDSAEIRLRPLEFSWQISGVLASKASF